MAYARSGRLHRQRGRITMSRAAVPPLAWRLVVQRSPDQGETWRDELVVGVDELSGTEYAQLVRWIRTIARGFGVPVLGRSN